MKARTGGRLIYKKPYHDIGFVPLAFTINSSLDPKFNSQKGDVSINFEVNGTWINICLDKRDQRSLSEFIAESRATK